MTNFEKIKSLNEEELINFLYNTTYTVSESMVWCNYYCRDDCRDGLYDCKECIKKWLDKEVEE